MWEWRDTDPSKRRVEGGGAGCAEDGEQELSCAGSPWQRDTLILVNINTLILVFNWDNFNQTRFLQAPSSLGHSQESLSCKHRIINIPPLAQCPVHVYKALWGWKLLWRWWVSWLIAMINCRARWCSWLLLGAQGGRCCNNEGDEPCQSQLLPVKGWGKASGDC